MSLGFCEPEFSEQMSWMRHFSRAAISRRAAHISGSSRTEVRRPRTVTLRLTNVLRAPSSAPAAAQASVILSSSIVISWAMIFSQYPLKVENYYATNVTPWQLLFYTFEYKTTLRGFLRYRDMQTSFAFCKNIY
jgi:hypothetical protein